jgi:Holliday junction DNA helicase RuvA
MIEFLRGTVVSKTPGHAILDVNGVGYGLEITAAAGQALPPMGQTGELHVYLYVQEAVLRLYGFASRQEREVFEIFLNTSGIGPRTAVAILSNIEMRLFAQAILQGDLKTLTRIPGIGKKTAERLSVELKDKLKTMVFDHPKAANGQTSDGADEAGAAENYIFTDEKNEAIEALIALGCKPLVAERAVRTASDLLGAEASTAELVREGLKHRR